jgi:3-hydroxyisobutyrate dehydrogenase
MKEHKIIGFIGLGVMGEPMCMHLARKSGATIYGADLDPAPLERLSNDGVIQAEIAEIGQKAGVIFLSLPDGKALANVANMLLAAMPAGGTVVDTTTAPVDLTRELAEKFKAAGIDYADAPIARTRQAARDGKLSVMVGAHEDVFARIQPLIACYATDITHCGDIGCGQVVKLMNNMVLVETVNALAEALTIGRRAGVDGDLLFNTLTAGSADSFALRNHGMKAMLPGTFPKKAFPATYMLKDLNYAQALAKQMGVTTEGATAAEKLLKAAIDAGVGEAYFPVLLSIIDENLTPDIPSQD